jgi:hypothetical protein
MQQLLKSWVTMKKMSHSRKPANMKIKPSLVRQRALHASASYGLVKPGAAKAMAVVKRRNFGDIKRHALGISAEAVSLDVADVRESFGFAPVDLQYKILSWPKL